MTLRYSDRPVVDYSPNAGMGSKYANLHQRFPAGARPIATANEYSGEPIWGFDNRGTESGRAIMHGRNGWQPVDEFFDDRTGEVTRRMNGETFVPVMWMPMKQR